MGKRLYSQGHRIHYDKGLVHTNEYAMEVKPRQWAGDYDTPSLVYAGGFGAGGMNLRGWFSYVYLAQRGFTITSSDLGDTPTTLFGTNGPGVWGNDAALDKLEEVIEHQETKLRTKPDCVGIMAGSHGAASACGVARRNPDRVKFMVIGIGTFNVEDIRANNRQSYQSSIEAAYTNNAGWQAARPTHNPVEYAAELSAIPMLVLASTNDPICLYDYAEEFCDSHGSAELVSLGAVSHTLTGADWAGMADWIEEHV